MLNTRTMKLFGFSTVTTFFEISSTGPVSKFCTGFAPISLVMMNNTKKTTERRNPFIFYLKYKQKYILIAYAIFFTRVVIQVL